MPYSNPFRIWNNKQAESNTLTVIIVTVVILFLGIAFLYFLYQTGQRFRP